MTQKEIEQWLPEWLDLWPADVEFNGYKIKSKEKDCIKKMQKFAKDNPNYTKDVIFAATKQYLNEKRLKDWAYVKQATYFISKLGQPSLLENYCEKQSLTGTEVRTAVDDLPDFSPIDDFI